MRVKIILLLILMSLLTLSLFGESRFPRPEFKNEYTIPGTEAPLPEKGLFWDWLDLGVLIGSMGLAAWLGLKKRSRKGLFFLSLFSLAYLGFWRQGCVCPVGSLQNVALALTDSTYVVPFTVVLFFIFPLFLALWGGRFFCSSVCPLGAIQDLVNIKPVKLPFWLAKVLGLFPILYLALAVMGAVTKAGFFICQYDPFVGFFRFGASPGMLFLGAAFLVVGVFIGRPYCRFLCPYGILQGWASLLSVKHISITPDKCVNCGLCADSCPFGAIQAPTPEVSLKEEKKDKRSLGIMLLLLPLIVLLFGFTFRGLSPVFSRLHKDVRLEEELLSQRAIEEYSLEVRAFYETGASLEDLSKQVENVRKSFRLWSLILGFFAGLLFGLRLIELLRRPRRQEYSINKEECFSCGRCMEFCPRDSRNFIARE